MHPTPFLLALACVPALPPGGQESRPVFPKAVEQPYRDLAAAMRSEDLQAFMSAFSVDYVFEGPDGATTDRGPWRRIWLERFDALDFAEAAFEPVRVVEETAERVVVEARLVAVVVEPADARRRQETALEDTWAIEEDGVWRLRYRLEKGTREVPPESASGVGASAAPAAAVAALPAGIDLARLDGWDIVIAEGAAPDVAYSAEELRGHLERATGVRLPVVTAADRVDRPDRHFFVGPGPAMRASSSGFDVAGFGPEDLRLVIRDGNVAIAGGAPRGTLYGVYVFLEDCLGVRFLTADHTHVPPVGPWRVVGPLDRFYHPPLAMRWSYYGEINRNPAFAARLRINTVSDDPRLGGRTGLRNINHSFYRQIPSGKYGREHPEYFAFVGGKRLAEVENDAYGTEPCLTHPDVLRIVTDAVFAELEGNPALENVPVSQNDNDLYCRCERCAAIDEREGTPMGSLLAFVNQVADAVAPRHPDVKVGTLSYWYSRRPPKTLRPRPNVQIQLCSIECCLIHPISDPACPKNVAFCEDLENWGAICDDVSIWNYNTDFTDYLLPCPNLRVIEPNVRFFVASGAKGIFMQAAGNAVGGELSELRNYVIASLIWDPTRSGEALIDEFLALHYGGAAPAIRRYVDLVHDAAGASGVHRNCFADRAELYGLAGPAAPDSGQPLADRALELFDEALALAGSDEVRARVEKASIGAHRLALEPIWHARTPAEVDPAVLERLRPVARRFLELCERHGVDMASEHRRFTVLRERLEGVVGGGE